jgi:flagellar basal body-associated protein FliL
MIEKKTDLLTVALLLVVAVFLIAIGLVVAWQSKEVTVLFRFLSMASFITLTAYAYYKLHMGENDAWR